MPPDFLNSREEATLVWLLLLATFLLWNDPRGVTTPVGRVLATSVQAKLAILFGFVLVYAAALVCLAWRIGACTR